jgi:hypothetical protein
MQNNFFIENFDSVINTEKLEQCHLEICAGIAKSQINISSRVMPHLEMRGNLDELIKYKNKEDPRISTVANAAKDESLTELEKKYYSDLNFEQKKKFLQLYKQAYADGEFVKIKFTKSDFANEPFATFNDSMCELHPNAQYFPQTMEFIKKLPFIETGRILIFVSYHYLHSDVHFDRRDQCFDGRNHFIWFNPFKNKSFFLIDENGDQKFIESKSAFFNTRYLHGSLPSTHMTYTLRIDGQLTKEFCDQTGILWSPR